MKKVTPGDLGAMMEPVADPTDQEYDEIYSNLDGNNESDVKKIINSKIKSFFLSLDEPSQLRLKEAYQFFLTTDRADYERQFESMLPGFDPPRDPKVFFIWVWEVLFPDEDYHLDNVDEYQITFDLNSLPELRVKDF